jgi:hypothetical protein
MFSKLKQRLSFAQNTPLSIFSISKLFFHHQMQSFMFFKKILAKTTFLLLLSTALFAQKVDLDPWRFPVSFRHFPNKPLDKTFTTYDVQFSIIANVRNNFSEESLKERVALVGFKQLDRRGHVTINVNMGDIFIVESKVNERVEIQKDKDGKETGRKYYYKPMVSYTFDATADARSHKMERLGTFTMSPRGTVYRWEGREGTSLREANDFLNNNRGALRDQFTRERVEEALRNLSFNLSAAYGYPIYTDNQQVFLLDNKKHPEYEGHQRVVNYVKEVLGKEMRGDEPLDKLKAQFEPLRTYLEESVKKYKKDDKNDAKMRYAAYYALAKISYWLDEPDDCIKYAEALIANGFDEKDGKNMVEDAQKLKADFTKNGMKGRHFETDTSGFEGPK